MHNENRYRVEGPKLFHIVNSVMADNLPPVLDQMADEIGLQVMELVRAVSSLRIIVG